MSKDRAALWLVAGILAIAWFRLAIPGLAHGLDFGSASGPSCLFKGETPRMISSYSDVYWR